MSNMRASNFNKTIPHTVTTYRIYSYKSTHLLFYGLIRFETNLIRRNFPLQRKYSPHFKR